MNYYHGNISAAAAEKRLLTLNSGNVGRYLLRKGNDASYIISFVKNDEGEVKHILVPKSSGHAMFKCNPTLVDANVEVIVDFISSHASESMKMISPLPKYYFGDNENVVHNEKFNDSEDLCKVCDKQISATMKGHRQTHSLSFCEVCETLITKNGFDNHKFMCHPKKKIYQCPSCDYQTQSQSCLTKHKAMYHGNRQTFPCDNCGKIFLSTNKLENHKVESHGESYKCKLCSKIYKTRKNLLEHVRRIHSMNSDDEENEEEPNLVKHGAISQELQNVDLIAESINDSEVPTCNENDDVTTDESDPRVMTLEEILRISMEGRWNDVTIICEGGNFQSNRFLLASMFPVVRDVFNNFANEEDIFMSIPNISKYELDMFFEAIYQKSSVLKVGEGILNLLGSKLQRYEAVKEFGSQIQNDHDYVGDSKMETACVKINFIKKPTKKNKKRKRNFCEICGKPIVRKGRASKLEHVRSQCRSCERRKLHCEICGKTRASYRMKRHMAWHVSEEKLKQCRGQCGHAECRKIFDRPSALRRHIQSKTTGLQTCHICGKLCKIMDEHMKRNHDSSRIKCNNCGRAILIEKLEDHQKSCEKLVLVCNTCGTRVSSKASLKFHIRKWHEVHEPNHECSICGKLFLEARALKAHLKCHQEKIPCPECGVKVRHLDFHMKQVHTPDDQQPHQCQDCGKGFFDMGHLEKHRMNVHLKLRPYNCRYGCDIAYNDTSNRNQHEKKTHGKLFTTEKEELRKLMEIVSTG